jgi:hypothetical protein
VANSPNFSCHLLQNVSLNIVMDDYFLHRRKMKFILYLILPEYWKLLMFKSGNGHDPKSFPFTSQSYCFWYLARFEIFMAVKIEIEVLPQHYTALQLRRRRLEFSCFFLHLPSGSFQHVSPSKCYMHFFPLPSEIHSIPDFTS